MIKITNKKFDHIFDIPDTILKTFYILNKFSLGNHLFKYIKIYLNKKTTEALFLKEIITDSPESSH